MCDKPCSNFQENVNQYLVRHQSILDILSKMQETNARSDRAVTKAVTQCGCIQIQSKKVNIPKDATIEDYKNMLDNNISGELCETCRDVVERELGKHLFYIAALCNALDLDFSSLLMKENSKISTLRYFNLT